MSIRGNDEVEGGDDFVDVTKDEGFVAILSEEVDDNWRQGKNITSLLSLDRFFVFPGEEVNVLACLSLNQLEEQNVSSFKDANTPIDSTGHDREKQNRIAEGQFRPTERLLQKFQCSHFLVRIAESDEALWSKRYNEAFEKSKLSEKDLTIETRLLPKQTEKRSSSTVIVDRGSLGSYNSGGVARSASKSYALPNGDIVVHIPIKVSGDVFKDPVLEVLQFEKYEERGLASTTYGDSVTSDQDPFRELLRWLLPLDNAMTRPRALPPYPVSNANTRSTLHKPSLSDSSSPQLSSFDRFKSNSMSSLSTHDSPKSTVATSNSRFIYDPDDWERFSLQKSVKMEKSVNEGLLSFRGVPLEPKRFSVPCGLEGMYMPARKWRKKIEIIQPVEISSHAAGCNTQDHLCVQIKNIAPAHVPDIFVYIDAITIVSDDSPRGGLPSSFQTAYTEIGTEHGLPNLALRRGEEHSFILKPAIPLWNSYKGQIETSLQKSQLLTYASYMKWINWVDHFAILVSCRCNYTESRLFFKQRTSWHPRLSRDLLISVTSNMSHYTFGPYQRLSQLPIQVLTLEASNLTSDDLTLTVLAPATFKSTPSVLSLCSSPLSPRNPSLSSSLFSMQEVSYRQSSKMRKSNSTPVNLELRGEGGSRSVFIDDQAIPNPDVLSKGELGRTHLWLQSKVPLGSVPPHSTSIVKLEVLPLTDGIITLDSLQIDAKGRGVTYKPEHALKIKANSNSYQWKK